MERIQKNKYYLSISFFVILLIWGGCGKKTSNSSPVEPLIETEEKVLSFILRENPPDNSVYLENLSIKYPEVTFGIKLKNGSNVFGASMEMIYDSSKIKYAYSVRGDLLGPKDDTIFYANLNKGEQGTLLIGIYKEGNASGANGDGTLVTIVFDIIALDSSTVIEFNAANCRLKSSISGNEDIPSTLWLGGTLVYK